MKSIFRVTFLNQDRIYEIYAKSVSESEMFSFVEIEDIVFGETTSVVVDPSEERLRAEFSGVARFYVPMHSIIRIDEVEKEGVAKIHHMSPEQANTNVSKFPSSIIHPPTDGKEKG